MIKKWALVGLLTAGLSGAVVAQERNVPKGVPHLDHAFVILMENHGYYQVVNNPNEPYLNSLIANKKVNFAKNYFAVGHPSLTNYLEIVGGSNFGIRSDNPPSWGDMSCKPNIETGIVNADNQGGQTTIPVDTGNVCPIAGNGKDAETPAVDYWNEVEPGVFNFLADLDGVKSVPSAATVGKSIADQLVQAGLSWKSYQESLPLGSPYKVNYSNGTVTNLDFDSQGNSTLLAPLTSASVVQDYAVKHNPFAYFQSVQRRMAAQQQSKQCGRLRRTARIVCGPGDGRSSFLGVYCAEPVRRSTRAGKRRRLLRVRLRRGRRVHRGNASRTESGIDPAGRRNAREAGQEH